MMILELEDGQTEIRKIIKDGYIFNYTRERIELLLRNAIHEATKNITIPRLQKDAITSLYNFANNQRMIWESLQIPSELLLLISYRNGLIGAKLPPQRLKEIEQEQVIKTKDKGVPLGEFYKNIWNNKIKPTLEKIVNQRALDPNDYSGRNSLRNLAEMEERYNDHIEKIESLREKKVKLVICSSHEDCSERCMPYQGKIYSLDGTTGIINGKKYVPLEYATQNPRDVYITKAGVKYQNGLLGFNCRHQLYEYKGQEAPTITKEERKKEYDITLKQRQLERAVRGAKVEALIYKGIDNKRYKNMLKIANTIYERYKEFSRENNRAFYPMRTSI